MIYSDTMKFKQHYPSVLRGYTAAQVFTNGKGFDVFHQIKSERQAADGLNRFIREVGIPEFIVLHGGNWLPNTSSDRLGYSLIVGGRMVQRNLLLKFGRTLDIGLQQRTLREDFGAIWVSWLLVEDNVRLLRSLPQMDGLGLRLCMGILLI